MRVNECAYGSFARFESNNRTGNRAARFCVCGARAFRSDDSIEWEKQNEIEERERRNELIRRVLRKGIQRATNVTIRRD